MWDGYIKNNMTAGRRIYIVFHFWTNKSLVYLCNIFLLNKNDIIRCCALDIMITREIHEKIVSLVVYFYNLINLYT